MPQPIWQVFLICVVAELLAYVLCTYGSRKSIPPMHWTTLGDAPTLKLKSTKHRELHV